MQAITPMTDTSGTRAVIVDITQELHWWRAFYTQFPEGRASFSQAEPTLKFAYDTYLLHPHARLESLWPDIHQRYDQLPRGDRMDWTRAEQVIGEVWKRILSV